MHWYQLVKMCKLPTTRSTRQKCKYSTYKWALFSNFQYCSVISSPTSNYLGIKALQNQHNLIALSSSVEECDRGVRYYSSLHTYVVNGGKEGYNIKQYIYIKKSNRVCSLYFNYSQLTEMHLRNKKLGIIWIGALNIIHVGCNSSSWYSFESVASFLAVGYCKTDWKLARFFRLVDQRYYFRLRYACRFSYFILLP